MMVKSYRISELKDGELVGVNPKIIHAVVTDKQGLHVYIFYE
jgi:hypothetical protein